MTDVKVRGVSPEAVEVLKKRAAENGRSLEGEIRHLLEGAVQHHEDLGEGIWELLGFQAEEIVPGRLYHVVRPDRFRDRIFRVSIQRQLACADGNPWYASVDEAVDLAGYERVWIQPDNQWKLARYASLADCLNGARGMLGVLSRHPGPEEEQLLRAELEAARLRILASAKAATIGDEHADVELRYRLSKHEIFGAIRWSKADKTRGTHTRGSLQQVESFLQGTIADKKSNAEHFWD